MGVINVVNYCYEGMANDTNNAPASNGASTSVGTRLKAGYRGYWTRDRIMWLIIGTALTVAAMWLIDQIQNVLLPFVAACLISFLLNPIVRFYQRVLHLRGRFIPVILTMLSVGAVLTGVWYICAPMIVDEINSLAGFSKYYASHIERLPFIPASWQYYIHNFNVEQMTRYLNPEHIATLVSKSSQLLSLSMESLMRVIEWLLMFVYIIFILIDYDKIASGVRMLVPMKFRARWMAVVGDVANAMNSYFRGQGFVALCACVLYSIGFTVVGLPLAIVMGLLVGVLYMIPYFQYVTLIPVAVLCMLGSMNGDFLFWSEFGKCALVYLVAQSTCDYVITPHVMGREMGLNPTMILLSLSIWGSLLGIIGMIIALPVTALIMAYYKRYISDRGSVSATAKG